MVYIFLFKTSILERLTALDAKDLESSNVFLQWEHLKLLLPLARCNRCRLFLSTAAVSDSCHFLMSNIFGVIVQVQCDLLLQHELIIQCFFCFLFFFVKLQQQIYHLQLMCFDHKRHC